MLSQHIPALFIINNISQPHILLSQQCTFHFQCHTFFHIIPTSHFHSFLPLSNVRLIFISFSFSISSKLVEMVISCLSIFIPTSNFLTSYYKYILPHIIHIGFLHLNLSVQSPAKTVPMRRRLRAGQTLPILQTFSLDNIPKGGSGYYIKHRKNRETALFKV